VSARFYAPDPAENGVIRLDADEARHLSRVCRLGVGDIVDVFDGRGFAIKAEVVRVERGFVELTPVGSPLASPVTPISVTLATAVPKGDRFDWLVEKATELGVERLIPIITERSVVEPGTAKLERLRKLIVEASKQCGRNQLMILKEPVRWDQVATDASYAFRLLADPAGKPVQSWPAIPVGSSVLLAVGPEGGFTPLEQANAAETGWQAIRLSSTILRIETAALVGCAALLSRVAEDGQTVH
jgi:16S rRNA (uracil1498-N3)-methyltransferase